jgi:hypothetical protein
MSFLSEIGHDYSLKNKKRHKKLFKLIFFIVRFMIYYGIIMNFIYNCWFSVCQITKKWGNLIPCGGRSLHLSIQVTFLALGMKQKAAGIVTTFLIFFTILSHGQDALYRNA